MLVPERRIPLPGVGGRIDHMALDRKGGRLFIAEVGGGAVETVDLAAGRVSGHIGGLSEPQGVAYLPDRDELVVATGGDGLVRFYSGDGREVGRIALGEDADNVRVEASSGLVDVGFGRGGIAVIAPQTRTVVRTLPLTAHPEAFQIDRGRAYVNLPGADKVAVLDLTSGKTLAAWPNAGGHFNFPMAIDPASGVVAVVYRLPSRLTLFEAGSGKTLQDLGTCGDADDVWFDASRRRIYVICGSGSVDVFVRTGVAYVRQSRTATGAGARTGLYDPALDRLFVAVPARGGEPAEIWEFGPR